MITLMGLGRIKLEITISKENNKIIYPFILMLNAKYTFSQKVTSSDQGNVAISE